MMHTKFFLISILFFTLSPAQVLFAQENLTFKEYLEQANTYIKSYRHFEASDALKKATNLGGSKHPSLHMRLGILYYGLGLIDEAIAEGEKAVSNAPSSKWYKYDLAKFYFVNKQYSKAKKQFSALLKLDPGFTLGYYYLAELYAKNKEYDLAWLCLSRAKKLGHRGQQLEQKIAPLTSKPKEAISKLQDDKKMFRFIKLGSAEKADAVLNQIWDGKLFENLELELKKDKNEKADFGVMLLSELKESVAKSLENNEPFSSPIVIKTGSDYRIMQRIVPFSLAPWEKQIAKTGSAPLKSKSHKIAQAKAVKKPQKKPTNPSIAKAVSNPKKADTETNRKRMGVRLDAFYVLETWKKAWENGNVKQYLATYSSNFIPEKGLALKQWKKKRQRSLTRPKYIHISIEDPVIETITANELLITFKQKYESNTYRDIIIKTLTMTKEGKAWLIKNERTIKKLSR